ncbi:spore germination protein YndE [Vallitalea longa]|uniref:Spore germination protein YndE n=1 Tax=Vallitalea longa TaxID=2936439 RepID=A0A9W6DHP1_9FIRM|nr:endospore germination permease [Vallitalea longa]GKX31054.1 spore germination protein YndE [Vallitalea longa]
MFEDGKISYRSVVGIIITTIGPTAILYLPTITYKEAKQDGWISVLITTIFGFIVAYSVANLGNMYKDKTIIQYSKDIIGKIPGKIIGFAYCIHFIYINAFILREFAELLAGAFMSKTPILFFVIGIILPSIYGVYKGLEVIIRINQIIFPIFMLSILAILAFSLKDTDFTRILPILDNGIEPIITGGYRNLLWFTEVVVLAMFIPYINEQKKIKKPITIALLIVGVLGAFINLIIVATFGANTEYLTYPYLSLTRYISVGFLERLDAIILFMWIAGVYMKIVVFHYCATLALGQWLNIKKFKILAIPIGILLVVLSYVLWDNLELLKYQIAYIFVTPFVIIQGVIPVLLYIIALIRNKFNKKKVTSSLNNK